MPAWFVNLHRATYQPGAPERIEDVNAASPECKAYYYLPLSYDDHPEQAA
jgi:hypothetical protein